MMTFHESQHSSHAEIGAFCAALSISLASIAWQRQTVRLYDGGRFSCISLMRTQPASKDADPAAQKSVLASR